MTVMTIATRLLLAATLLGQIGCAGTTPPAAFYLLEPATPLGQGREDAATSWPTVIVAPVRIPRYLERPHMVIAEGSGSYRLDEFHRWAESLDDNITRVMIQELSAQVPAHIVSDRGSPVADARFRLSVTVLAFHVDAAESRANFDVQWRISQGEEVIAKRHAAYRAPVAGNDATARVAALNDCLSQLNRDIADALNLAITKAR
ncbi:MAG: membrane integrity-associated transporter subunit PqiC [Methylomonas sp.]|nr:membrane integrity-associated transporter subunit PqiC [Methylomonas sp.]PPD21944.1 MAG: hypothetical protein CTY23_03750 [Methylomonas sp.]PPD23426.1 MAG: hypothetical protein CTY22_12100 [Methylomonas sp.]PPD30096.1 MAG: hypothetical protein CTY21_12515 [Methylomonas sp.]PPD39118.1 MAG: hypothetical protein CTY17_08490 [Methylomonas sp.]